MTELLFSLCVFGLVALLTWWIASYYLDEDDDRLRERLGYGSLGHAKEIQRTLRERIEGSLEDFVHAAGALLLPRTREAQGRLRQKLAHAGIYSSSSLTFLLGCRVLIVLGLGLAGFIGYCFIDDNPLLGFSIGGFLGYGFTSLWLLGRMKIHRRALETGLPDALDLLVVCVESGLTIDAALQRVGEEIRIAHPRLAQELEITHMETRVGLARSEAMRNLARRTGSPPLMALSSMLIQAERFGTSVAAALRIHAEGLRLQRQHRAEELAAKASVKISFPVVLFIFPAVLIVLGGPALIGLFRSALFAD